MLTAVTRTPFTPGVQRLETTTLRALADALPALYAETDPARLPRVFTEALASLVPGESHGVVVHDRARGQRFWHLRPASSEHEKLVPVFFGNFHEFEPAHYRKRTGSGAALAFSDFTSRLHATSLAIYEDYYRPLGLEDDLNINIRHGEVVTCAAVLRRRRGFSEEERELMNALRPHFKQAWANAAALAHARAQTNSNALESALIPATKAGSVLLPSPEWTPDMLALNFGLTPREAEVLLWVAQGKTNPEVAQILGIRPYTVRTHLERVFTKLGVETRHAASLRAIEVLGLPR